MNGYSPFSGHFHATKWADGTAVLWVGIVRFAHLILRQWKEDKRREEDTPIAAVERTLREMGRRNPALQTLIDTLGLVPVVDDG